MQLQLQPVSETTIFSPHQIQIPPPPSPDFSCQFEKSLAKKQHPQHEAATRLELQVLHLFQGSVPGLRNSSVPHRPPAVLQGQRQDRKFLTPPGLVLGEGGWWLEPHGERILKLVERHVGKVFDR